MRIAALYDIHGNLPALEAVLEEVRQAAVDLIVIGGDVLPGPLPRETLTCLLALDLPAQFLQGNGESAVLAVLEGREPTTVPEALREVVRWTAEQLSAEQQAHLARWPLMCQIEIDGLGEVLFCHATPQSNTAIFTRLTPDAALLPIFADVRAPLVICGHTHMPFDRQVGPTRVVNAGSVGMPFGRPGAAWLLLGPDVQPRHTSYDLAGAAARIRTSTYPQAETFASRNVLQPPSEQEMLAALTRSEVQAP